MRDVRFGKVFIVTHAKSVFSRGFGASPLVTSAFGQRSVGLQPRHPAARNKNPLVTTVRFNTTLSCIGFSFLAMKVLAKAAAIFVPMAVLWACNLVATEKLEPVFF